MTAFEWPKDGERGTAENAAFYRNPKVAAWRTELALRSELTASDYVRRLALFSRVTGLAAAEIVRRAKERPEAFRELLSQYAAGMLARGRKSIYVRKHFDALASWLSKNSVSFDGFPEVAARRDETLENEASLTPDQLRQLLSVLDPRAKVVALLMSQSGLRPGVLGSITGTSGLVLGSLVDLDLSDPSAPKFGTIPARLVVRADRSKNAKSYTTFVGSEGAETLLLFLRQRVADGEGLSAESPVIGSRVGETGTGSRFVATKSVVLPIHRALVSLGIEARPYTLRSYFSSQLLAAEARGHMIRDAREAMLGHDLGVSGRYNLSKKLNPTLLEELRALYGRAYQYLSTSSVPATSTEEVLRMLATDFLDVPETELTSGGPVTVDRIREFARRKKDAEAGATDVALPGTQKVVEIAAVEQYIAKGWRFVAPLNGTKAVLEAPATGS